VISSWIVFPSAEIFIFRGNPLGTSPRQHAENAAWLQKSALYLLIFLGYWHIVRAF